jgi:hypothetical protein
MEEKPVSNLNIQRCPETGICTIIAPDGRKIDLMPDEASSLAAADNAEAAKAVLAEVDAAFAGALDTADLDTIVSEVK